ncbi:MAG: protein kinase [Actinomycetota bacterium]|nr:protein kinase [Actinomycetota bacterium]
MLVSPEVVVALRRKLRAANTEAFPGFTDVFEIGTGSLATVYRAREIDTNRQVALKLLNVRDASPRALESFQRESIALGALSAHPNIVTLFRTFSLPDGRPVLVLELCSYAVSDRLRGGAQLPVQEAVSIAIKIAGALETAHRAQILHRDVKPQNILVTEFGEPALADFGVAMLQSSTQTTAGLFDFTTLHAAPELLEGGATSAATDVYELASTLYQLIVGQSAFRSYDGESPASVILRILRDPVQPVVAEGVPVVLSDLLIWAMSKDKDHRPPTAAEFAAELSAVETEQGWPRTQFLIRETGTGMSGGPATITRMPERGAVSPAGPAAPDAAPPPGPAALPQTGQAPAAPAPPVLPWIQPAVADPTWTPTGPTSGDQTSAGPASTESAWSVPTWSEPTLSNPTGPQPVLAQPVLAQPDVPVVPVQPLLAQPGIPVVPVQPVLAQPDVPVVPEVLEQDWRDGAARRQGPSPAHAAPSDGPVQVETDSAVPAHTAQPEPEAHPDPAPEEPAASLPAAPTPATARAPSPVGSVAEPPAHAAASAASGRQPAEVSAGQPAGPDRPLGGGWAPPPADTSAAEPAPAPDPPLVMPTPPSGPYPLRAPRPPMPVAGLPGRSAWTAPPPPPPPAPPPAQQPPAQDVLPPRIDLAPPPAAPPGPVEPPDLLPWPDALWTDTAAADAEGERAPESAAPSSPAPDAEVNYPIPPAGVAPGPDQGAFGAPAAALRVPRPGQMQQFGGDIHIDPMSLRRRLRLHAGMSALTVDDRRVSMRVGAKRSRIQWTDVLGFEPRVETVDDEGVPSGSLIALTTLGPVQLPATRGSLAEVRYAHAMLDAYRLRAQLYRNSR